jgi:hypothetical protein
MAEETEGRRVFRRKFGRKIQFTNVFYKKINGVGENNTQAAILGTYSS